MTAPNPAPTPAPSGIPGMPTAADPEQHAAGSKEAVLADLAKERDRRQAAETKAKDFDAVQAELQKYKDQHQTAEQKQAEQLATLTSERDTATVKALRYEVCEAQDLPLKAAQFLTGNTRAEIEKAATAFKELYSANTPSKPATGLPPSPNAGRETPKQTGAEAGLAKARERFGDLVKK